MIDNLIQNEHFLYLLLVFIATLATMVMGVYTSYREGKFSDNPNEEEEALIKEHSPEVWKIITVNQDTTTV